MDVPVSDVAAELASASTATAAPDYRVVILGAGKSAFEHRLIDLAAARQLPLLGQALFERGQR